MAAAAPSPPLVITRWASQSRRAPPALEPGHVGVDERDFGERLADTAHFAAKVRYFNLGDREEGSWDALLNGDPAVLLALIATLDLDPWAERIRRSLRRLRRNAEEPEVREEALDAVIRDLLRLAGIIDRWVGAADLLPGDAAAALIERALEELVGPRLRRLLAILRAAERAGHYAVIIVVSEFHHRWRLDSEEGEWEWRPGRHWLETVVEEIAQEVEAFLAGLQTVVGEAAGAFQHSLDHSSHPAHVGLLLTFLKLLGRAQDGLNEVPLRLARFYHERVVGAAARRAEADRLFLAFRRAPGARQPPLVQKGHLFAAAGADGSKIRFEADETLAVTGAEVRGVRLWQPEGADPVRRLAAVDLAVEKGEDLAPKLQDPPAARPVEVGILLAGEAFRAESGARTLTVTLRLSGLGAPVGAESFADLVGRSFRPAVATPEGWRDVEWDAKGSRAEGTAGEAVFRLQLGPDDPPLAGGRASAVPAVRLLLVPDGEGAPTPLSAFESARVTGVSVAVEVRGLGDLKITTSSGPVVAAAGTPAFGIAAGRGGWLQVDHPMLGRRELSRLRLNLRWEALPPNADGFTGYYRDYVVGLDRRLQLSPPLFTNEVFRVCLAAAGPDQDWSAELPLFAAPAVGSRPSETASFELPSTAAAAAACAAKAPPSGVRLTLVAPDYGFGDLLYPANVAHATAVAAAEAEKASHRKSLLSRLLAALLKLLETVAAVIAAPFKLVVGLVKRLKHAGDDLLLRDGICDEEEEGEEKTEAPVAAKPAPHAGPAVETRMPNPPWRAGLAGLSLDYEARFELQAGAAEGGGLRLLHWRPFEGPAAAPSGADWPLLPSLPVQPCLDLLVAKWPARTPLSLLFVPAAVEEGTGKVEWSLGGPDGWSPLPPMQVDDHTEGLGRPGIVRFAPPTGGAEETWLRASMARALPRLGALIPDALTATRSVAGDEEALDPVPAGAITGADGINGIAGLVQPLPSSGGRKADPPAQVAARTGETLRHRRRAVLPWDYERIVLDAFPEVARVRVLPARGAEGTPSPGSLLVVVVPEAGAAAALDPWRPQPPQSLCERIRSDLAARVPQAAKVAVVAPAYAPVAIRATVALARGFDAERVETDVRAFLSPLAEDGPRLRDLVEAPDLADSVVRFLRTRPYVEAVADVTADFDPAEPKRHWMVPVAGKVVVELAARESLER